MENITSSVEAIENEAQKILDSAEKQANEILLEAADKAKKISSSKLALDDVQVEASETIQKARQQAEEMAKSAQQESLKLRSTSEAKINTITKRILNIIIENIS